MEIPQPVQPSVQPSANYVVQHKSPKRWLRYTLIALVSIIIIFIAGSATAEFGLANTGFDRLYGRTKLAGLWGGMPANPAVAIQALLANPELITIPENASTDFSYKLDSTIPSDLYSIFAPEINSNNDEVLSDVNAPALNGSLDNAISTTPNTTKKTTQKTATDINVSASLDGSGLYLNTGEKADLNFTFRLNSNLPGYENIPVQSRFILNGTEYYYQVPSNIKLLTGSLPWFDALPADIAGKYVRADIPSGTNINITGFNEIKVEVLDNEELTKTVRALSALTKRVSIERINGDVASHWQIVANMDNLSVLVDNGLFSQADFEETKQFVDLNITLDLWIRNGDYAILKTTSEVKFAIKQPNPENIPTFEVNFSGEQSVNPNIDSNTKIELPTKDQIIDEESLLFNTDPDQLTGVITDSALTDAQLRDRQRVSDLSSVSTALNSYYEMHDAVPVTTSVIKIGEVSELDDFLFQKPTDPLEQYYYGYVSPDGQSYTLTAVIEDSATTTCETIGQLCIYKKQESF